MRTNYAPTLLAWSCMSMLASALPQNMGNLTLYGPDKLSSQTSNTFLSCVNKTGTDYKLYVEEFGTTIALPPTNRTIDFEGQDQALFDCIVDVNLLMEVAAESSVYDQNEFRNATPSRLVTHEWLSKHGALGKKPVGSRPPKTMEGWDSTGAKKEDNDNNNNTTSIKPRQSLVYWAYPASDKGCQNSDLEASHADHCHNSNSAYDSIQFENTAQHEYLKVDIWPHHRCQKGNNRRRVIHPGTLDSCQKRTTYSWEGSFSRCRSC